MDINNSPVQIVQNRKATIFIKFRDINDDPVDITSWTDIQCCFEKQDGTDLTLGLIAGGIAVIGNPLLGKIAIALTAAQTLLLAVKDPMDLELAVIIGSADPFPVIAPSTYEVLSSQC